MSEGPLTCLSIFPRDPPERQENQDHLDLRAEGLVWFRSYAEILKVMFETLPCEIKHHPLLLLAGPLGEAGEGRKGRPERSQGENSLPAEESLLLGFPLTSTSSRELAVWRVPSGRLGPSVVRVTLGSKVLKVSEESLDLL